MEKLVAAETEVEELKNKQEDLEYSLENATSKVEKLDRYLCEAYQKLHTLEEGKVTVEGGGEGVSKKKVHLFYWAILHVTGQFSYLVIQSSCHKKIITERTKLFLPENLH